MGLIDFQWAGFGLAGTEVASHIVAALDMDCLSYDGSAERDMLDFYYDELLRALVEFGAAGGPEEAAALLPREALQEQYETAVLDMCRVVFAYQVKEPRSAGVGGGRTGTDRKKLKVGAAQRFAGQPGEERCVARAELVQQVGAARVLARPAVRRPPPRARRAGGGQQQPQADHGGAEAHARGPDEDPQFSVNGI